MSEIPGLQDIYFRGIPTKFVPFRPKNVKNGDTKNTTEVMPMITGKIHIRNTETYIPNNSAKSIASAVSILAIPANQIDNDRMYVISGQADEHGIIHLTLTPAEKFDSTGYIHGSLMLEPIWQV